MQSTSLSQRVRATGFGRIATVALTSLAVLTLAACSSGPGAAPGGNASVTAPEEHESPFDLTTKNIDGRPRIDPVPEAVEALKKSGFKPAEAGKLTTAHDARTPPLNFLAEDDNKTLLGSETDIAQLVADGLGLEYEPRLVSWSDWPLGIESGKYDVAVENIGVTEERKDLFDFATYRDALMSFAVKADSKIDSIKEAKDVAGLTVVVGSGTNQEKILLSWIEENKKAGLEPGEAVYYDDTAAAKLALGSGRVDVIFQPYAVNAYTAAVDGETKNVGTINSGFPGNSQVGLATAKGNGLIEAVSIVFNHIIENGEYQQVLERWAIEDESIAKSEVNPPGLPRP